MGDYSFGVAIGNGAANTAATGDGWLSIQNIIFGVNNVGTDSTVSSGRIGIGIKLPAHKLDVERRHPRQLRRSGPQLRRQDLTDARDRHHGDDL